MSDLDLGVAPWLRKPNMSPRWRFPKISHSFPGFSGLPGRASWTGEFATSHSLRKRGMGWGSPRQCVLVEKMPWFQWWWWWWRWRSWWWWWPLGPKDIWKAIKTVEAINIWEKPWKLPILNGGDLGVHPGKRLFFPSCTSTGWGPQSIAFSCLISVAKKLWYG